MTSIEWTTKTWNPIAAYDRETGKRGWFCTRVSPGCENCYAESRNVWIGNGQKYRVTNLGKVDVRLVEKTLVQPLRWRTPAMIFPCSMTDLFLDAHPDQFIAKVFAVMALADWHTYQVLTKRPDRMHALLSDTAFWDHVIAEAEAFYPLTGRDDDDSRSYEAWVAWINETDVLTLPNVWLGVSVEAQLYADTRIPLLLKTPAPVRWLSCEPLLGPLNITPWLNPEWLARNCAAPIECEHGYDVCPTCDQNGPRINWVVIGGESGPGARPFNIEWAESLVSQCRAAGVAPFVKQLGAVPMEPEERWRGRVVTRTLRARNHKRVPEGFVPLAIGGAKGGDMTDWPQELRVREYPAVRA